MYDVLIIGGGIIGLSLARELADRHRNVLLVDRQHPGTSTSWAASGILPPPARNAAHDPVEQMRTLSHDLYPTWSAELLDETGIDNELRCCGGIYLARRAGEAASLRAAAAQLRADGIEVEDIDRERLTELEPGLAQTSDAVRAAYFLPHEHRIRTPRHLKALIASCRRRGVEIRSDVEVHRLELDGQAVIAVATNDGPLTAHEYCVTTGTWTAQLLEPLGWTVPIRPWRGQILLWKTPSPLISRVVNEGIRYLVPRDDGHILAGSSVEDVGFACHTTEEVIDEIKRFSIDLLPQLEGQKTVKMWAGLRPGAADGLPYIGRVPGLANLTLAAGHFRSGIHLAPATAVVTTQLLLGEKPRIDLTPFRLNR